MCSSIQNDNLCVHYMPITTYCKLLKYFFRDLNTDDIFREKS